MPEASLETSSERGAHAWAYFGQVLSSAQRKAKLQGLALLALVLLSTLFYASTPANELVLCPLRAATGMQCAGCGMTRSWCALSAGRWELAVMFNPFGPLLYTLAVLKAGFLAVEVARRRRLVLPHWERLRNPALGTIAVAMMSFSVFRAWQFFAGA